MRCPLSLIPAVDWGALHAVERINGLGIGELGSVDQRGTRKKPMNALVLRPVNEDAADALANVHVCEIQLWSRCPTTMTFPDREACLMSLPQLSNACT